MATKRLTPYQKALNRLIRVETDHMLGGTLSERAAQREERALKAVLDAHWSENHPLSGVGCEWCDRFPPLDWS